MGPITFVRQVGVLYFFCVSVCVCVCLPVFLPPCDQSDSYKLSMSVTVSPCLLSQVLAACLYPELLKDKAFPLDVRQRAQTLLGACGGQSVGENENY